MYSDKKSRRIIREEVAAYMREFFAFKDCPNCKAQVSMLRVTVVPESEDEEVVTKWRCTNCQGLFKETLVKET
jgi:uncharacterized protein with PIN domain